MCSRACSPEIERELRSTCREGEEQRKRVVRVDEEVPQINPSLQTEVPANSCSQCHSPQIDQCKCLRPQARRQSAPPGGNQGAAGENPPFRAQRMRAKFVWNQSLLSSIIETLLSNHLKENILRVDNHMQDSEHTHCGACLKHFSEMHCMDATLIFPFLRPLEHSHNLS